MTPAEHARQIDQEEFAAECAAIRQRAYAYSKQKRDERRRHFLVMVYGTAGESMTLWPKSPMTQAPCTAPMKAQRPATTSARKPKMNLAARRPARLYTVNDETLTTHEWADRLGLSVPALYMRASKLGSIEAAIEQGGKQRRQTDKRITYSGLTLSRSEWAERLGLAYDALCQRISRHGPEQAVAMGGPQRVRSANDNAPGVVLNFCPGEGTGAGRHLQESTEITFSEKAITE